MITQKNWQLNNEFVEDDGGQVIAVLPKTLDEQSRRLIAKSPQLAIAMQDFVDEVNKGKLKQRSTVRKFEQLLLSI